MKTANYNILWMMGAACAALSLALACERVQEEVIEGNEETNSERIIETRTFSCTIDNSDTKLDIDADGKTTWEVGDMILIHGEKIGTSSSGKKYSTVVTLTASDIVDDGKTAKIRLTTDTEGIQGIIPYIHTSGGNRDYNSTLYAAYPADAVYDNTSYYSTYYHSIFSDTNRPLMVAYDHEDTFVFKNVCAAISFTLPSNVDFDSYTFTGNKGETVGYGRYTVKTSEKLNGSEGNYFPYTGGDVADPVSSPKLSLSGSVVCDGTTLNTIFLPNGTSFEKGFKISLVKDGVPVKQVKNSKAFTVSRNQYYELGDISSHMKAYVEEHKSAISTAGATNLASLDAANCYEVNAPGTYKFPAVKGNSDVSVGNIASVELLWETYNNETSVTANSVIAAVDFEDDWIYFQTPVTLLPGNALIAAKKANGTILWSWHIWIPANTVQSDTYGISTPKIMDRNLGALVVTQAAESNVDAASYGMFYQWGRKDPFLGPKRFQSSSRALSTNSANNVYSGTMTVEQTIQQPTTFAAYDGDWIETHDSELWGASGSKTIYDPCPPGYRVPKRNTNDLLWSKLVDSGVLATGFEPNSTYGWFTLGTAVFPFASYIDSNGSISSHSYDRAKIWTANQNTDTHAYDQQIWYESSMWKSEPGWGEKKARGCSVRCVKEFVSDPIPAPDVTFAVDGNFSEWGDVEAIDGDGDVINVLKVGSDATKVYFYIEIAKSAFITTPAYAYAQYLTMCFDNGDDSGSYSTSHWNSAYYDKYYQFWTINNGNYKLSNWSVTNLVKSVAVDGDVVKFEWGFDRSSHSVFSGKYLRLGVYLDSQTVDNSSGNEVWGGSATPIGYAPASNVDMVMVALKR